MLVHSVFFWLKPELDEAAVAAFRAGVESLQAVPNMEAIYIGTPSVTDRPVIDRSYSVGLTVLFKGVEEHDAYQVDPIHRAFVDTYSSYWDHVVIYDVD
jgi:hypothetical protein